MSPPCEHSDAFLPYSALRSRIKSPQMDARVLTLAERRQAFRGLLEGEMARLNDHLSNIVDGLELKVTTTAANKVDTLANLAVRCRNALLFAEANAEGLRKISKKFDKKQGTLPSAGPLQQEVSQWVQIELLFADLPRRLHQLQEDLTQRAHALVLPDPPTASGPCVAVGLALHIDLEQQRPNEDLVPLDQIVAYTHRLQRELALPNAVLLLSLMHAELLLEHTAFDWHLALTLGMNFAAKLFFDESPFIQDLTQVTARYSLDELKLLEHHAFDAIGLRSATSLVSSLALYRSGGLALLVQRQMEQPTVGVPRERRAYHALVVDADAASCRAHVGMLLLLDPDCCVTTMPSASAAATYLQGAAEELPELVLLVGDAIDCDGGAAGGADDGRINAEGIEAAAGAVREAEARRALTEDAMVGAGLVVASPPQPAEAAEEVGVAEDAYSMARLFSTDAANRHVDLWMPEPLTLSTLCVLRCMLW